MTIDQIVATKMEEYFLRLKIITKYQMHELFDAAYDEFCKIYSCPAPLGKFKFHINNTGLVEIVFSLKNKEMPMVQDIIINKPDKYKAKRIERKYVDDEEKTVIFDLQDYQYMEGCTIPEKLQVPVRIINKTVTDHRNYKDVITEYAIPAVFYAAYHLDWTIDEIHSVLRANTEIYTTKEIKLIKKLLLSNKIVDDSVLLFIKLK